MIGKARMELSKLKPVVNAESWQLMLNYLESIRELKHSDLINADTRDRIYRAQGQVKLLNELIGLRDKVNGSNKST